jgi:hypothetical protein
MFNTPKNITFALILLVVAYGVQCNDIAQIDSNDTEVAGENLIVGVSMHVEHEGEIRHANKFLTFETNKKCQTWAIAVQADEQSSESYYQYFATPKFDFKATSSEASLTWEEIGPKLDLESVETACKSGEAGNKVTISSSDLTSYHQIYLKVAYHFEQ